MKEMLLEMGIGIVCVLILLLLFLAITRIILAARLRKDARIYRDRLENMQDDIDTALENAWQDGYQNGYQEADKHRKQYAAYLDSIIADHGIKIISNDGKGSDVNV